MTITEWSPVLIAAVTAGGTVIGAYFTAKYGGKSGAKDAQGDLSAKVATLITEVAEARKDASAAKVCSAKATEHAEHAFVNAEYAAKELQRHEREEKERRHDAREAGQRRDAQMADGLDNLLSKIIKQGEDIAEIRGRLDRDGGRRGR